MPVINIVWCNGCGICVKFCPEDALVMDHMGKIVSQATYPLLAIFIQSGRDYKTLTYRS